MEPDEPLEPVPDDVFSSPQVEAELDALRRRPGRGWRWVAMIVVAALILTTPIVFLLGRRQPRSFVVPRGATYGFEPGSVRPGELLRCGDASVRVPDPGGRATAAGATIGTGIEAITRADGGVVATCH